MNVINVRATAQANAINGQMVFNPEDIPVFLDVRSGIYTSTDHNPNGVSFNEFKCADFQNNVGRPQGTSNFTYITAEQIGGLVDSKHGVTLQHQADAIRVNRTINGQATTRISDTPTLTVLMYGQGGDPSHWSNNGERMFPDDDGSEQFFFDYRENSLIEILRRTSNAHVWVASAPIYRTNYDVREVGWENFEVRFNEHYQSNAEQRSFLRLHKIESNSQSYLSYCVVDSWGSQTHETFVDFSRHNIIIFNTDNSEQYHDYVYNQLAATLIQISYDYLLYTGQVPLINMISHSTGGNWNMMFANRFPLNVSELFAMAAPFKGSTLGNFLYLDFPNMEDSLLLSLPSISGGLGGIHNMILNPSGFNNVSAISQARMDYLRNGWNRAVEINPNLHLFSLAGLTSIDFFAYILTGVDLGPITAAGLAALGGAIFLIASIVIPLVLALAAAVLVIAASTVIALLGGVIGIAVLAVIYVVAVRTIMDELAALRATFGGIISHIWYHTYVDSNGVLALHDDVLVALYSAVPSSEFNETDYFNNVRDNSFVKTYRPDNVTKNADGEIIRKLDNLAVPHNLHTKDTQMIQVIESNIITDEHDTRFVYTELLDGTLQITGIRDGFFNERIIIPKYIGGRRVTYISSLDVINEGGSATINSVTEELTLGRYVTNVGNEAFAGISSLEEINFTNAPLIRIGNAAFYRTGISTLSLPITVREIGNFAFAYTNLDNVAIHGNNLESHLWFVGENAFAGTPWINANTANNLMLGRVLVRLGTSVTSLNLGANDDILFFAQMVFAGTNLQSIDLSNFTFYYGIDETGSPIHFLCPLERPFITLPDNLFNGARNLESVILPNDIIVIGNSAFEGTTNLRRLSLPETVGMIGSRAFANSGLTHLIVNTGFPPMLGSEAFLGVSWELRMQVNRNALDTFIYQWNMAPSTFYSYRFSLEFYDNGVVHTIETYLFGYLSNLPWMQENGHVRIGYYFVGWFDVYGNRFGDGALLTLSRYSVRRLYARFEIYHYAITFEHNGGSGSGGFSLTTNDIIVLEPSTRTGFIFDGWFDNPQFAGLPIETLQNISSDIRLFAKWTPISVNINFVDVSIANSYAAVFGQRFHITTIPTRYGYAFAGWYDVATGRTVASSNGSLFVQRLLDNAL